MEVVESLKTELSSVNEKLAALDQLKNDRAMLTAQAARLTKAIALLTGEPVARKEMSPEAKERIRLGLAKARAAKLAAGNNTPVPKTAQPETSGTNVTVPTAKKPVTADKAAGRVS